MDQKFRKLESSIVAEFGQDSREYSEIWKLIEYTDLENQYRVKLLLEKFGYPEAEVVGTQAANVPCLVIHHSTDQALRHHYFPVFEDAANQGNLDSNLFLLFLERMYQLENGTHFKMESPYQIQDKIDTLIKVLQLRDPS
ncbi:hypothetical protein [Marinoscillum sp.]|uniref:hypothetical protein n=1 Tax=Marinoscillum sp. TaxID=2024838 RepID=UPI003BABAC34